MKIRKKNKRYMSINNPAGRKGLTFIETMLAIGVLSITIMASSAASATYLKSRISIKKYQASNEEMSLALNYLAKDIRMSGPTADLVSNNEPHSNLRYIKIVNNETGNEITYTFDVSSKKLTRREVDASGSSTTIELATEVLGQFYIYNATSTGSIPRITIEIEKTATDIPVVPIQTTVSMRTNYVSN